MPEKVTIPISIFDYSSDYARPIISIWMDRAALVQRMFDELARWGLEVNNVEPITSGKPSDQGIKIQLPQKRVTLFFGPTNCKFTRDAVDWSTAHETAEILQTFLATLTNGTNVQLVNHKTALILHLQPSTKKLLDILKPFLSESLKNLRTEEITSGAAVVKWKNGRITLDGSAVIANAVYLKYEQEFDSSVSFEQIAAELHAAEDRLFQILDLEEEL